LKDILGSLIEEHQEHVVIWNAHEHAYTKMSKRFVMLQSLFKEHELEMKHLKEKNVILQKIQLENDDKNEKIKNMKNLLELREAQIQRLLLKKIE